jgi:hypothetical protein
MTSRASETYGLPSVNSCTRRFDCDQLNGRSRCSPAIQQAARQGVPSTRQRLRASQHRERLEPDRERPENQHEASEYCPLVLVDQAVPGPVRELGHGGQQFGAR